MCKKLIGNLLIQSQRVEIKIHDLRGVIMRHNLMIAMIMNDMSEDLGVAKQMHQITEIEDQISQSKEQIALLTSELKKLEVEIMNTNEVAPCCGMDVYADVFAGRGVQILNREDFAGVFAGAH